MYLVLYYIFNIISTFIGLNKLLLTIFKQIAETSFIYKLDLQLVSGVQNLSQCTDTVNLFPVKF